MGNKYSSKEIKAIDDHFSSINRQANKLIEIFLVSYFIFGIGIGFAYNTVIFALVVGGLNLSIYFLTKVAFPNTKMSQYAASAVFAFFMAQFIYQMHGLFEMHFFAFIGATLLIKYQNWKSILPLALIVALHHFAFAYLQAEGIQELNFSQIDWDLLTFLLHVGLAVAIFLICALWSYEFQTRSIKDSLNLLKMNEMNNEVITKSENLESLLSELNKKNKSITDSINYAQRIQTALNPTLEEIQQDLPKSSIFFKAKDVVSGDFPYYHKKDGYLYVAAVDCTGHGVPGAMLSLIGHLLLDHILDHNDILEPHEVLYLLDKKVSDTLKQQDSNSLSRDGMDIALCRIHLETNSLVYSGAHRSLYHRSNNNLTTYNGNNASIGGRKLKQEKIFTSEHLSMNSGDSVFFFTDGLPDQFGGENSTKYGYKRLRKDMTDNENYSSSEMIALFKKNYEEWMGEEKQIDDVLIVGIDF